MKYYFLAFRRILDFKGESTIIEFWSFFFLNILASLILLFISKKIFNTEVISDVYKYFSLIPLFSLGFRRLRNGGISPWLFFVPFVNLILAGLPEKTEVN